MDWRQRGIFRAAVVVTFGSLLLARCSSGTAAPLKAPNHLRREDAAPLFELIQRKRPNISAGGLEAPGTGTTLGNHLLVHGDFTKGLEGWDTSTPCFRPDASTPAP